MLKFLRNGVKSLPAKILIGLLVASFAVWGIGDVFSFRLDSRVAKVGDTEIPAQRFTDALMREHSRISRQAGQLVSLDMIRSAGIERGIISGLIRDAAFEEELKALGIAAPDEAVAEAIRSNPNFLSSDGTFSTQSYQLLLAQQRFSPAEFEELTRTLLAQQLLTETAEAAIVSPPGAAARIAAYQGENRAATTLALTLDTAPDPGTPDEGALRAFYEANEPMFTEPERRWGEYIHVDAARLRTELTPDEATLRATYEADIGAYSVAESRVIDQIAISDGAEAETAVARLASGDVTFEALADELDLDSTNLSLGEVTRNDLPDVLADVVFDEPEPGIIGPVELPAGFAIIRIREITQGSTTPFEEVRDQIAEQLAIGEALARAPELANQIDELRAEGLTISEIASRVAESSSAVIRGAFEGLARDATLAGADTAEGVEASAQFIDEVFTALDSEERDLIETTDGGYLLIWVERIEPTALQTLEQVRERAVAAWQTAERRTVLETQGAELAARLGDDVSIWDIGAELGLAAVPYEPFSRLNPPPELPAALVEEIFRAEPGRGGSAASDDGNQILIAQVANILQLDPEAMAENSAGIDQALVDSLQSDTSEYFARAVVSRYDAQIEPGVIDEVFRRLGASGTMGR